MIFARRIARHYFSYFFALAFILTTLVILIQFLERMTSAQEISLSTLCSFLLLDTIPTFFLILPLASWLSMLCLLRDWQLRGEWESMMLLSIYPMRLIILIFSLNMGLGMISFGLQKIGVARLAQVARKFKREKIKKTEGPQIKDRWILLEDGLFCLIKSFDTVTHRGVGLFLFKITLPTFSSISGYEYYETFTLSPNQKSTMPDPVLLNAQNTHLSNQLPTSYLAPHKKTIIASLTQPEELPSIMPNILDLLFFAPITLLLFACWYHPLARRWYAPLGFFPCFFMIKLLLAGSEPGQSMSILFFIYILFLSLFFLLRKKLS